jgi:glyoxylase I family protein
MRIDHALAVVAVRDIATAREWYERLFGRSPDNSPMESLIEWRLTDGGWLQVTADPERAGRSLFNLAVADLPAAIAEVTARGIVAGDVLPVNKGVELCPLADPDGNAVTLIGGFRVEY